VPGTACDSSSSRRLNARHPLDFCAENGLGVEIEKATVDQVDEAYERIGNSDVRYRFLIDTASFGDAR
jgi:D-arabinose 1-dehydrogenase-like Zn-dependent alcohol dehydrogenase